MCILIFCLNLTWKETWTEESGISMQVLPVVALNSALKKVWDMEYKVIKEIKEENK